MYAFYESLSENPELRDFLFITDKKTESGLFDEDDIDLCEREYREFSRHFNDPCFRELEYDQYDQCDQYEQCDQCGQFDQCDCIADEFEYRIKSRAEAEADNVYEDFPCFFVKEKKQGKKTKKEKKMQRSIQASIQQCRLLNPQLHNQLNKLAIEQICGGLVFQEKKKIVKYLKSFS